MIYIKPVNVYEQVYGKNTAITKTLIHLTLTSPTISEEAFVNAKIIRGINKPPALMLYGVAPRSGTNYVANVLANHLIFWPILTKFMKSPPSFG